MANQLNGLSLTAIAEESLPQLQAAIPPLLAFNTDFSGDTAAAFSGISTRYPSSTTASYYTRAAGYVANDASSSAVTITLSDVLYSAAAFTDYEVSTITMPRLINTFLKPCMNAVVTSIFNNVVSPIKFATYGSASFTGSSFTFDNYYQSVIGKLKTNGVTSDKSVVLNSSYFGKLLSDVKQNYVIGTPDVIRNGTIGTLGGATPYEAPGLGSNGEALVGFGCGKEALTIATRQPVIAVSSGIEDVAEVVEPMSGLTFQLRLSRNPWTGLTYIGYYILAGSAIGNPNALVRITDGTRW